MSKIGVTYQCKIKNNKGEKKLKTPIALDFANIPEAVIPDVDLNVFKSIAVNENVVLVRGMYNDGWRTFIALVYDAETGEALDMKKAGAKIRDNIKLTIKPVGMLFDALGMDLAKCKSADGNPIVFDDIEIKQKPS